MSSKLKLPGDFFVNRMHSTEGYVSNVDISPWTVLVAPSPPPDRAELGEPDVVLVSEEGFEVAAHRRVLVERSAYFDVMLRQNSFRENRESRVQFHDLNRDELEQLVDFIYGGQVRDAAWVVRCVDRFQLDWSALRRQLSSGARNMQCLIEADRLGVVEMAEYFAGRIAENIWTVASLLDDLACGARSALERVLMHDRLRIRTEEELADVLQRFKRLSDEERAQLEARCRREPFLLKSDTTAVNSSSISCQQSSDTDVVRSRFFYATHMHLLWTMGNDNDRTGGQEGGFNVSGRGGYHLSCVVPEKDRCMVVVHDLKDGNKLSRSRVRFVRSGCLIFLDSTSLTVFDTGNSFVYTYRDLGFDDIRTPLGVGYVRGVFHLFYEAQADDGRPRMLLQQFECDPGSAVNCSKERADFRFLKNPVRLSCLQSLSGGDKIRRVVFCGDRIFGHTSSILFMVDPVSDAFELIPLDGDEVLEINDIYRWGDNVIVCVMEDVYRVRSLDCKSLQWTALDVSLVFVKALNTTDPRGGRPGETCDLVEPPTLHFDETEDRLLLVRTEHHYCFDRHCDELCALKDTSAIEVCTVVQMFRVVPEENLVQQVLEFMTSASVRDDDDINQWPLPRLLACLPVSATPCDCEKRVSVTGKGVWYP